MKNQAVSQLEILAQVGLTIQWKGPLAALRLASSILITLELNPVLKNELSADDQELLDKVVKLLREYREYKVVLPKPKPSEMN